MSPTAASAIRRPALAAFHPNANQSHKPKRQPDRSNRLARDLAQHATTGDLDPGRAARRNADSADREASRDAAIWPKLTARPKAAEVNAHFAPLSQKQIRIVARAQLLCTYSP
jgi:hypothetical protein